MQKGKHRGESIRPPRREPYECATIIPNVSHFDPASTHFLPS